MNRFLDIIDQEFTYKSRIHDFWHWFGNNNIRFKEAISQGRCEDLSAETISQVDKLIPGISWSYGPGRGPGRHSFTLSAQSNPHWVFLTRYWLDCAPSLDNWDFQCFKQASPLASNSCVEIDGKILSIKEVWLQTEVDPHLMLIDIKVWHPAFMGMDDMERFRLLFFWLDEVLGECNTESWVGQVDFNQTIAENAIPLLELGEFIDEYSIKHGWSKPMPCDSYTLYERPPCPRNFLRTDTLLGHSSNMRLIGDYFEYCADIPDPLIGSHAFFIFISFTINWLPEGKELIGRSKIEQKLCDVLETALTAKVTGSAIGEENCYIDFIIFDGYNSVKHINETLKEFIPLEEIHFHLWTDV